MKCAQCHRSLDEGITLIRINPLGEVGIFICQQYCGAFSEDEVENDIIEAAQIMQSELYKE